MRVLDLKTLRTYWDQHPHAERPLRAWYTTLSQNTPRHLSDLKALYRSVDSMPDPNDTLGWYVFDIAGNHHRVICRIDFTHQFTLIKHVLSHAYDDRWTRQHR